MTAANFLATAKNFYLLKGNFYIIAHAGEPIEKSFVGNNAAFNLNGFNIFLDNFPRLITC